VIYANAIEPLCNQQLFNTFISNKLQIILCTCSPPSAVSDAWSLPCSYFARTPPHKTIALSSAVCSGASRTDGGVNTATMQRPPLSPSTHLLRRCHQLRPGLPHQHVSVQHRQRAGTITAAAKKGGKGGGGKPQRGFGEGGAGKRGGSSSGGSSSSRAGGGGKPQSKSKQTGSGSKGGAGGGGGGGKAAKQPQSQQRQVVKAPSPPVVKVSELLRTNLLVSLLWELGGPKGVTALSRGISQPGDFVWLDVKGSVDF